MTEFNYVDYMQMLATANKLLHHDPEGEKHFYRVSGLINLDELLQGLNAAAFPALFVVDSPEGRLVDRDSSNLLDTQYFYFFVLQKADIDDAASRETAISDSKTIIKQLLSRMFRDKTAEQRNPLVVPAYGIKNLNRDSISYKTVGPIGDSCYGMWCSFTLINYAGISYSAAEWED